MLNIFFPPDEYQMYPTPQELSLRSSYITLTDFITLLILVQVRRFLTILHYNMKTCSFEFCTSYKLENYLVTTFRNSPLNHSLSFLQNPQHPQEDVFIPPSLWTHFTVYHLSKLLPWARVFPQSFLSYSTLLFQFPLPVLSTHLVHRLQ